MEIVIMTMFVTGCLLSLFVGWRIGLASDHNRGNRRHWENMMRLERKIDARMEKVNEKYGSFI